MAFRGHTFVVVGPHLRASYEIKDLIVNQMGTIDSEVTTYCSYVVISWQGALLASNSYQLQWNTELSEAIDKSRQFGIPCVDESFIDECILANSLIDPKPYLSFGKTTNNSQENYGSLDNSLNHDIPPSSSTINSQETSYSFDNSVYHDFSDDLSPTVVNPSQLDPRVAELVELILNQNELNCTIEDMKLDQAKITTITQQSILQAYSILSDLESAIHLSPNEIPILSEKFYRLIPHKHSQNLDSLSLIKEKMENLNILTDIVITKKLINQITPSEDTDIKYRKLKTKILPLEKYTKEYSIIENYVNNTQAAEHTSKFTIELLDVFEIERDGELERFKTFGYEELPNHKLLWHGSRLSNFAGILTNGLRIAPPQAPVTGYYLGKGLYFADMISKSAFYCRTTKANNIGLMLLCDVALGRCFQISHGKYITKEDLDEAEFTSAKGCGEYGPASGYDVTFSGGIVVPVGKEGRTPVLTSELTHNEYVAYDVNQVLLKYLVKVRFDYVK